MTPEERSKLAYAAAVLKREAGIGEGSDIILAAINGAIAKARIEAIEECARVAEMTVYNERPGNPAIAAAIRALNKGGES